MAFRDRVIGVHELGGIIVVRISGIPWLFSSVELPPELATGPNSGLTIFGGELYRWSNSLKLTEGIGSTTESLAPKAGMSVNGGMKLGFSLAGSYRNNARDIWLNILCNNPRRADVDIGATTLTLTMNAAQTGAAATLGVVDNVWIAEATRVLYVGLETVDADPDTGSAVSIPCTRGRYGSQAKRIQATLETPSSEAVAAGVRVTEFPLVMNGRIVEVWFMPGEWVAERLRLFGDLDSDENRVMFAGPLTDIAEGGVLDSVDVSAVSADKLLDVPACSFFPRAVPYSLEFGPSRTPTRVYMDTHNDRAHILLAFNGAVGDPFLKIADNSALVDGDTVTVDGTTWTFKAPPVVETLLQVNIQADAEATAAQLFGQMVLNSIAGSLTTWGPTRRLNAMVFITALKSDPSITMSTSLAAPAAIVLSGATLERISYIKGIDLDLSALTAVTNWVAPSSIAYEIGQQLEALIPGIPITMVSSWFLQDDASKPPRWRLTFSFPGSEDLIEAIGGVTITVLPSFGSRESVVRDLGITEAIEATQSGSLLEVDANKAAAVFRWPGPDFPPAPRLHISFDDATNQVHWSQNTNGNWVDDDGAVLPITVTIGKKEMVELSSVTFDTLGHDYGVVAARGVLNSLASEEIFLELKTIDQQKFTECQRLPSFTNTSAERFVLYLIFGGGPQSPYGRGWPGFGANVDERLVDVASFGPYIAAGANVRDNWTVRPGDNMRDLIAGEGLIMQQFLVLIAGRLGMIDRLPVSEASSAAAVVLDHTKLATSLGTGFDRKENRICNLAEAKINFSNAGGKFGTEVDASQADSVATYGPQQSVDLQARGVLDVAGGLSLIDVVTKNLFGQHALPNALIEVKVASWDGWVLSLGDEVKLTHDTLPKTDRAGRGVTEIPCRVSAIKNNWLAPDGGFHTLLELVTDAYGDRRSTDWAPSALLTSTSDVGTTWAVAPSEYGGGAPVDGLFFRVGDSVRVVARTTLDLATSVVREIASVSVDGLTISFTVSLGAGVNIVMWFNAYDSGSLDPTQRSRGAFMSDGDGNLDAPGVDDPAYRYV